MMCLIRGQPPAWIIVLSLISCHEILFSQVRAWTVPVGPLSYRVSVATFAGFGSGSDNSNSSRKASKKRRSMLSDLPRKEKEKTTLRDDKCAESASQLDRWGLPLPTAESIFPALPEGTEIIPVDPTQQHSLEYIQKSLFGHMDLKLDIHFDEKGTQTTYEINRTQPMRLRLLHRSPPVLEIQNFFTRNECSDIRNAALDESCDHDGGIFQVDSATFRGALSTRTSTSWFSRFDLPCVIPLIAKAHALCSIPLDRMEEPQIVRYLPGQEFSWHYDEVPRSQLNNGGQRLATLLVYLNDMSEDGSGGGTVFRDLRDFQNGSLTMRPKLGSALLFFPAFSDGRPDDRTLHKGEKVFVDTEKWIIQMWIHQRAYRAALPSPSNLQSDAAKAVEEMAKELGYNIPMAEKVE